MNESKQSSTDGKFSFKKIVPIILVIITLFGVGYAIHVNNEERAEKARVEQMKKDEAEAKKKAEEEAQKAEAEAKAKAEAEQKEKDRKIAHDKALAILSALPNEYDKIEEKGWYKPFGSFLPNRNSCTWYVGKQGDRVWMRGILAFYTENGHMISDWSINKIVFASSAGKYTMEMKESNGVGYETNDGAKFKRKPADNWRSFYQLDCDYASLKEGYAVLVSGSSPVIRYYHSDGAYDQYVNQEDINSIKTSLALYEYFSVLDNKL